MAKGDAWLMEWSAVVVCFVFICSFLDPLCGKHIFFGPCLSPSSCLWSILSCFSQGHHHVLRCTCPASWRLVLNWSSCSWAENSHDPILNFDQFSGWHQPLLKHINQNYKRTWDLCFVFGGLGGVGVFKEPCLVANWPRIPRLRPEVLWCRWFLSWIRTLGKWIPMP